MVLEKVEMEKEKLKYRIQMEEEKLKYRIVKKL